MDHNQESPKRTKLADGKEPFEDPDIRHIVEKDLEHIWVLDSQEEKHDHIIAYIKQQKIDYGYLYNELQDFQKSKSRQEDICPRNNLKTKIKDLMCDKVDSISTELYCLRRDTKLMGTDDLLREKITALIRILSINVECSNVYHF